MNKSHLIKVAVAVGMMIAPASANGDEAEELGCPILSERKGGHL